MGWDGADVMGLARWADMMGWCLGCLLVTSRALTAGGLMVNLQSCPKKEGFCDHFGSTSGNQMLLRVTWVGGCFASSRK
mgnify:CR=1 FL=1